MQKPYSDTKSVVWEARDSDISGAGPDEAVLIYGVRCAPIQSGRPRLRRKPRDLQLLEREGVRAAYAWCKCLSNLLWG
jgi:hypothetical protein